MTVFGSTPRKRGHGHDRQPDIVQVRIQVSNHLSPANPSIQSASHTVPTSMPPKSKPDSGSAEPATRIPIPKSKTIPTSSPVAWPSTTPPPVIVKTSATRPSDRPNTALLHTSPEPKRGPSSTSEANDQKIRKTSATRVYTPSPSPRSKRYGYLMWRPRNGMSRKPAGICLLLEHNFVPSLPTTPRRNPIRYM